MEPLIRKTVIGLDKFKDWVLAQVFFAIIAILKLFPAKGAIWFCAEAARGLGKYYPRNKMARENLKLAFPAKSNEEIEHILQEMWANVGRVGAEYIYLDDIFHIDEDDYSKGLVEVVGNENFLECKAHEGPAICFTAHTGNWELLPIAASTYGMDMTALFRPPNNRYLAERVLSARTTKMGHLVPSKAGASWALADVMDNGGKVGMLVDQFFARGQLVDFLGRETLANPLLSKLVRHYNCPVYPVRCVRLPEGRFQIVFEPALDLPRTPSGGVDQAALTQLVTDRVASWVREYPEQWLWLHKRWRPKYMEKWHQQQAEKKTRKT